MAREVRYLKVSGGELIALTEYDSVTAIAYVLNDGQYAYYYEEDKTLERNKAASDVLEVIYEGAQWPSDMPAPTSYPIVLEYFLENP
jgi:hypothetical protein